MTVGSFLFAYGFALFIEPANIAPGGISGIVVIITRLYPALNSGLVFLMLNIPILIIGALIFGIKFFIGTLYAILLSSVTMSIAERIASPVPLTDPLLMSFIGALISGFGLALVFRVDATTGGTDIIAKLIHKRFANVRLGWIFFILDAVVIILSGVIFGEIYTVVLSAFSAEVTSFVFNYTLYFNFSKKP